MRVFFDASVIIAAILSPTGGSALLIRLVQQGKMVGVTSQTVVVEITDIDKTAKLDKSFAQIGKFIARSSLMVCESISLTETKLLKDLIDPEDAHLVAGAQLTSCTHLVTLDKKHLLKPEIIHRFKPLVLLSPKELIELVVEAR